MQKIRTSLTITFFGFLVQVVLAVAPVVALRMAVSKLGSATRAFVTVLLFLARRYEVVLQVNRDSPAELLLKAYKKVVLKVHHDKSGFCLVFVLVLCCVFLSCLAQVLYESPRASSPSQLVPESWRKDENFTSTPRTERRAAWITSPS